MLDSGLTDVHSRVSKLCEHLYIVSFWAWGARRVREPNPKKSRDPVPIVQMIAVWGMVSFWLADRVCSDDRRIMTCLAQILSVLGGLKARREAREPLQA